MRNLSVALMAVVAGTLASGQDPLSFEFHHLYTFGSRLGIHPPKTFNRRSTTAVAGQPEHPFGLAFPVGVATDPSHRVWITDRVTGAVHVYDTKTGAYREIRKVGDELLQQPAGIAIDPQGRVFISDSASGGLFAFDEKGEYDRVVVKPASHRLSAPTLIALSENGRTIYVADPPNEAIVELNREGEVDGTIKLPPECREPVSLAVVANQVYVLGNRQQKVGIFSPGGFQRGELHWEEVPSPSAFAYDSARQLFFVANGWMIINVLNEGGKNAGSFGHAGLAVDQMQRVDSLYVDPDGMVYIIDSRNGKVLVFANSGHH